GNAEQHAKYLTPMIEGETSLALAWQERGSRYDVTKVSTVAKKDGDGYALTGEKVFVLNGHAADHLIVSARTEEGALALFVVDPKSEGVSITSITTMDSNRAAQIALHGAKVPASARLTSGDAAAVLEWSLDMAAAAACAEGLGIARAVLEMTNDYL